MILTGAQILWECLVREGVDTVFGYPGGAILPAYDTMLDYPVREAFHIARTGRPGPVLVDVCKDVQQVRTEFEWPEEVHLLSGHEPSPPRTGDLTRAAELVERAARPEPAVEAVR